MAQIGSEKNPVVFRKATVSKPSRFRKGMDLNKYKDNYDRIFNKRHETEMDSCRAKSKTFSMEQE
jgi:hypothetical protein|tara:strand:+ start:53 stop:247 length:195 start_codon:yes stop_codon:yes gene_type:complete